MLYFENMDTKEYNQLKQQAEARYSEAIATAKSERDETVKAIDKVWSMLKTNVHNKANVVESATLLQEYGSLTENVKKALGSVVGTFDKNDLIEAIGYSPNESSFDGCLRRLVKKGIIKVFEKGSGRRAAVYKKVRLLQNE